MNPLVVPAALGIMSLLLGGLSGGAAGTAPGGSDSGVIAPDKTNLDGPEDWYADVGGTDPPQTPNGNTGPSAPANDLQPIPEPTTFLYAFLGTGMGALSLIRRRRK